MEIDEFKLPCKVLQKSKEISLALEEVEAATSFASKPSLFFCTHFFPKMMHITSSQRLITFFWNTTTSFGHFLLPLEDYFL